MLEPRCPACVSPEINPDRESTDGQWRCENCGERFDYEAAFIQLGEAEDFRSAMETKPLFYFDRDRAEAEVRDADSSLRALNPFADAGELHCALDAATECGVIGARRANAALHAYEIPAPYTDPVLGVDPGTGAELVGPALAPPFAEEEEPVSFTVRWLEQIVASANDLLAGQLHAASGRPAEADLDADGLQSHRRYVAVAYWLRADSSMGESFRAGGTSIPRALGAVGRQIEAGDFDPQHSLHLAVFWADQTLVDDEERTG